MSDREPTAGKPWGAPPADAEPAELQQARALRKANKPFEALTVLAAFLERAPNAHWRFEALDVAGDAHADTYNHHAVRTVGDEMIALNPGRPEGFVTAASAAMAVGQMRDAIEILETGLSRHPRSHQLMALTSLRHARIADTVRALEWAERAMAIAPEDVDSLTALDIALQLAARRDEAKWAGEQARIAYRRLHDSSTTDAQFAFADGDFRKAYTLTRQVLVDNPQNPKARQIFLRARIYRNPVLAPFLAVSRLNRNKAIGAAVLVIAALGTLYLYDPRACGIVAAGIGLYYLGCICLGLLVEGLYDPTRAWRR